MRLPSTELKHIYAIVMYLTTEIRMGLWDTITNHLGVDTAELTKQLRESRFGKQVASAKDYLEETADDVADTVKETVKDIQEFKAENKKALDRGEVPLLTMLQSKEGPQTKAEAMGLVDDLQGMEDQSLAMLMAGKVRPRTRYRGSGATDETHDLLAVTDKIRNARAAKQAEIDRANAIANQKSLRYWDEQKPGLAMEINDLARREAARGWQAANNVNPSIAEGVVKKFYQDKVAASH